MRRAMIALVSLALLTSIGIVPGGNARAVETRDPVVLTATANRAAFGLYSDPDEVAALMASGSDVGTGHWGIPLTAAEEATLDLPGRMAFADFADQILLPQIENLPGYSSAYIDQSAGGHLVLLFTDPDAAPQEWISSLLPDNSRPVRYAEVRFTEDRLISAAELVPQFWREAMPGGTLLAVRLDIVNGRLDLAVAAETSVPPGLQDQLESQLGIPVDIAEGIRDSDTHCTIRDHCHAPTWAGIRLYKGAVDSQHECGLAFHIRVGTNERFTTAGHCGYSGSNNWLHPPVGLLGAEVSGGTLYRSGGQDIMQVELNNDAEASDNILACCTDIVGYGTPILGETLCTSLAELDRIRCGSVTQTWYQYVSDTPDPDIMVWGGDLNILTINGDSGSPVYRKLNDPNENQARAVGVNTTEFGSFARLDTSLDDWSAVVVN